MPTYDYQCKDCGYTFEEFQSISAEPLVTCPSCGKPKLKRLLAGGAGMIFKGSGFYLTDYKNSKTDTKESKPKKEKEKESSKSEPKSDKSSSSSSTQ